MSEQETLTTGETDTIYGTLAGGKAYLAFSIGDQYDAWRKLTTDDQRKMAMVSAKRYLERFAWNQVTAATFAARDAILDTDNVGLFAKAQYELAALGCLDPSKLSTIETGSNIKSAGAGSASVEFFGRTSVAAGTALPLPDVAMQLVGKYLAASEAADMTYGQSGNCESAFEDSGEFTKVLPG